VSVSPVMGKGFPVEAIPADAHPTVLLFATGEAAGCLATWGSTEYGSMAVWAVVLSTTVRSSSSSPWKQQSKARVSQVARPLALQVV
jgi:hypothetical protein